MAGAGVVNHWPSTVALCRALASHCRKCHPDGGWSWSLPARSVPAQPLLQPAKRECRRQPNRALPALAACVSSAGTPFRIPSRISAERSGHKTCSWLISHIEAQLRCRRSPGRNSSRPQLWQRDPSAGFREPQCGQTRLVPVPAGFRFRLCGSSLFQPVVVFLNGEGSGQQALKGLRSSVSDWADSRAWHRGGGRPSKLTPL